MVTEWLAEEQVAIVSKEASREVVASEEAAEMMFNVVVVRTMTVVNAVEEPAEVADSVAPEEVVLAVKAVAKTAITLRSMRTCFNTGTRLVSRTRERRQRFSRRKSSTVSLKSTTSPTLLAVLSSKLDLSEFDSKKLSVSIIHHRVCSVYVLCDYDA